MCVAESGRGRRRRRRSRSWKRRKSRRRPRSWRKRRCGSMRDCSRKMVTVKDRETTKQSIKRLDKDRLAK